MSVPTMTCTLRPAARAAAQILGSDLVVVEVGVQAGDNAAIMLQGLRVARLWLIDVWGPYDMNVPLQRGGRRVITLNFTDAFAQVCGRFASDDRVRIIRNASAIAAKDMPPSTVDFVYIDACHDYDMVRDDIAAWWLTVKPGGILAGHDYHDEWPGVIRAVDEFAARSGLVPSRSMRDWWVIK